MNMRIQIAPPAPKPVAAPADYAAQVAADIAARYGCAVSPELVRIAPRGATGQLRVAHVDGKLVLVTPDGHLYDRDERMRQSRRAAKRDMDRRFGVKPETAARRREIQALHDQGLTMAEMVALGRGWSDKMVRDDHRALGLVPINRIARTHEQILAMARGGGSARGIAAALNISPHTVRSVCRAAGVVLAPGPHQILTGLRNVRLRRENEAGKIRQAAKEKVGRVHALQTKDGERHQRIIELAREGRSSTEILAAIGGGVKYEAVRRVLQRAVRAGLLTQDELARVRAAGLARALQMKAEQAAATMAARGEVLRLYVEEGLKVADVAQRAGLTVDQVRHTLCRAGVFEAGRDRKTREARRAWILSELRAGKRLQRREVAARFGVTVGVIQFDLKMLEAQHPEVVRPGGLPLCKAESLRMRARIIPLLGRGLGVREIAAQAEVSVSTVKRVMAEVGHDNEGAR